MNFKTLRDKLSFAALVSGLCFLIAGLLFNYFLFLSKFSTCLFWTLFFATILLSVFSFPKWKSFVAFAISFIILFFSFGRAMASYHSRIPSPDGKYQLVVYRVPMLFASPGGGSDAACYVQLQTKSGKTLNEGYLEMILILDPVDWSPKTVYIGRGDGSYSWDLPE